MADAWYPIGNNPRFPIDTLARYRTAMASVRQHAEESGRRADGIDFAYNAGWQDDRGEQKGADGKRLVFTGNPEQVASDIREFGALGVRHLVFGFGAPTAAESMKRMERFAKLVMPLAED
jgi:alkanesulfonate monooxygenase SsuD/methylene tetrahydromethanopterin reductase-like flavin-dependent oxidoreductase (luciferase family)